MLTIDRLAATTAIKCTVLCSAWVVEQASTWVLVTTRSVHVVLQTLRKTAFGATYRLLLIDVVAHCKCAGMDTNAVVLMSLLDNMVA